MQCAVVLNGLLSHLAIGLKLLWLTNWVLLWLTPATPVRERIQMICSDEGFWKQQAVCVLLNQINESVDGFFYTKTILTWILTLNNWTVYTILLF